MSKKYFNEETEKGIVDFQNEKDFETKKRIFDSCIRPAFNKLIENIIFVYQFKSLENLDILENDCMSYLFECIYKFNPVKGAGFSYFNQICKNWFLQEAKYRKKRIQQDVPIDKEFLDQADDRKKFIISAFEDEVINVEFLQLFKEELNSWNLKVKNKQEKRVLDAVIILFKQIDDIQLLNKKSIYVYLREITKLNTKQIALNLGKLKKRYFLFKKRYHAGKI